MNYHRKRFRKLTFRGLALRQSEDDNDADDDRDKDFDYHNYNDKITAHTYIIISRIPELIREFR